jgi:ubiquinone/menaquinone biosynthesis C-methylase UbiE
MGVKNDLDIVPIEAVRDYWNARPCNIRHSAHPPGEIEYFKEVETRKYFVEQHIPRFADFDRWKGKRVLEIGCGIGTDSISFARAGAKVTAIDLSDRSLELAIKRARVLGLSNIKFLQANVESLASVLPPEPYDLVYAFGVIHHTPRPEVALHTIRQYLTSDGILKLMVYHRYSWKVLWILASYGRGQFWNLEKLIAQHSEAQTGCPVTYTYSRKKLLRSLKDHGYTVKSMFVDHIFPWRIKDYIQYRYRKVWYFRILPLPLFRVLERQFGWHLCVTAKVL